MDQLIEAKDFLAGFAQYEESPLHFQFLPTAQQMVTSSIAKSKSPRTPTRLIFDNRVVTIENRAKLAKRWDSTVKHPVWAQQLKQLDKAPGYSEKLGAQNPIVKEALENKLIERPVPLKKIKEDIQQKLIKLSKIVVSWLQLYQNLVKSDVERTAEELANFTITESTVEPSVKPKIRPSIPKVIDDPEQNIITIPESEVEPSVKPKIRPSIPKVVDDPKQNIITIPESEVEPSVKPKIRPVIPKVIDAQEPNATRITQTRVEMVSKIDVSSEYYQLIYLDIDQQIKRMYELSKQNIVFRFLPDFTELLRKCCDWTYVPSKRIVEPGDANHILKDWQQFRTAWASDLSLLRTKSYLVQYLYQLKLLMDEIQEKCVFDTILNEMRKIECELTNVRSPQVVMDMLKADWVQILFLIQSSLNGM